MSIFPANSHCNQPFLKGTSILFSGKRYLASSLRVVRRRQWHPTPVLLPGKSHGRRSLVGCSPWGRWVGHDWATSLWLFTFMHWRRKWEPTSVCVFFFFFFLIFIVLACEILVPWLGTEPVPTALGAPSFNHLTTGEVPTPVFLPGESQGRWSLVGCHLRDRTRVGHDWSDLAAAAAEVV